MFPSAKTEYASLAMLELAARYHDPQPVRIRQIADQHGIPSRFLVQILLQLKGAGLVSSTRGASGGYQLTRPPDRITLAEVMAPLEGQEPPPTTSCKSDSPGALALLDVWQEIHRARQETLEATTLADLVERARGRDEHMYYI